MTHAQTRSHPAAADADISTVAGPSSSTVLGRLLTRRIFIKAAGAAGAGFVMYSYLPGGTLQALADIPGGISARRRCPSTEPPC